MSAKSILDNVKEYLRNRVEEGINLLIFVLREGRFTDEEKAVFKIIMEHFETEVSCISALVLTHCDTLTDGQREKAVQDFVTKPSTMNIAQFMKKGIFDVGFTTNPLFQGILGDRMKKDAKRLKDVLFSSQETKLNKSRLEQEGFWAGVQSKCTIL